MSDSLYVRIRPEAHRAQTSRRVSPYGEAVMSKGPVYEVHPAHAHEFLASPQTFEVLDAAPVGVKLVAYSRPPIRQNMPKPPAPPRAAPAPEEEDIIAPTPPPAAGAKPNKRTRGGKKDGEDT